MEIIKRFNLLHIISLILLLGAGWSCTDEHIGGIDKSIIDGTENTVTFSVRIPGASTPKASGPKTYTMSVDDENEVNEIAVLLFDTEGEFTFQPIYRSGSSIVDHPTDSRIKNFTIDVPKGTYNMVFLANINQSLDGALANISVGQPKDEVLNTLLLSNNDKWNATSSTNYTPIPMWGDIASIVVSSNMASKAPVNLIRMVSKIDVDISTNARSKFNLQSVQLYNYNNKGRLAPVMDAQHWDSANNIALAPSVPTDVVKIKGPLVYDGDAITKVGGRGTSLEREIYTFEAEAGSTSTLSENTYLVIGGIFDGDIQATYYRIDIANSSEGGVIDYLPLLRNHSYKVNITDVKGSGFLTPADAFASHPINIEAGIISWDDSRITEIVFDGQYMLGVSQSEFSFTGEKRDDKNNDNKLSITTDYPSGWRIDKIVDGTGWLSISSVMGDSGATTETKLLLSKNNTENTRVGYIHFSGGRLNYRVKVEQHGIKTANSYIVAPNGGVIRIPVARANESELGTQLAAGVAFTAHLVWTDNSNGLGVNSNIKNIAVEGAGPSGDILVETGSASGNALVAIKNSSGTIIWSWHIWVTDYKPSGTFMDRNLGAIGNTPGITNTFGLLYQWGRKDPFPGNQSLYNASGAVVNISTDISALVGSRFSRSFANPTTYYAYSIGGNDWVGPSVSHKNDELWGRNTTTQTVYDPCPAGWRVPKSSVWVNMIATTPIPTWDINGLKANSSYGGFYPAAGARLLNNNGNFADAGVRGYYWSASVDGYQARDLYFHKDGVSSGQNVRSNAYSVRCVKE